MSQDIAKQEMWSDTRRVIREALASSASCATIFPDLKKDQEERFHAKSRADQAEAALRDMVKALFDSNHAAAPMLAEAEILRAKEARLRAELEVKTAEACAFADEVEALRLLVDALIRSASPGTLSDALRIQSKNMADIINARRRSFAEEPKP